MMAHFWVTLRLLFPGLYRPGLYSCYFCGVVKPRDPFFIKACRGRVRIELR